MEIKTEHSIGVSIPDDWGKEYLRMEQGVGYIYVDRDGAIELIALLAGHFDVMV